MTKVKLNPLVDLGLASDPNYNANDAKEVEVDVQNDLPVATPITSQPVQQTYNSNQSAFNGISDIASYTPPSEPVAVTAPAPVESSSAPVKTVSSADDAGSKTSNILFILSISLFVVSIAALLFFALKYFKVI